MQIVQAEIKRSPHLFVKNFNVDKLVVSGAEIHGKEFKIHRNQEVVPLHPETTHSALCFTNCRMNEFPSPKSLLDAAKHLSYLEVSYSHLSKINRDDLKGLLNLKTLYLGFNDIECLPRGLFDNTPNLEYVSFKCNKIKVIDSDILNPLKHLRCFSLMDNVNISAKYEKNQEGCLTLEQLKDEIKRKCKSPKQIWEIVEKLSDEVKNLKTKLDFIENICETQAMEIEDLKEARDEQTPFDFVIKIHGRNIKVNKAVLAANSPMLARILSEHEDAENMELKDLSFDSFNEILNFMYNKGPPSENADLIELYTACYRLQMKELVNITTDMLKKKVTSENANDILALCEKYKKHDELNELRVKAQAIVIGNFCTPLLKSEEVKMHRHERVFEKDEV